MGQRGEQGQHVPRAPSVLKRPAIPAPPCDGAISPAEVA